jgi:5-(carboxyamino)imidazole ribonucleotide synthase
MSLSVGVIGGGQLARMMVPAAVALGIDLRVFAASNDESAGRAITSIGDFRDVADVLAFARQVDVVTFDHEHVPFEVLTALVDEGISVQPRPEALLYAQDKLLMREKLAALGISMPDWARVESESELGDFLSEHGDVGVLKTPRGGYDGKGVRVVRSALDAADWFASSASEGRDGALLVEERVEFRRELAQLVARNAAGEISLWPVVETVQVDGVCSEVIAPAPDSAGRIADVAADIATRIAENLGVTGVLAVELFETTDDRLVVNELAMRPHNSGHWSIDGATTSQFEQHVRAVLNLPLGATGCRDEWSVMVNILGDSSATPLESGLAGALAAQPMVKVHNYGKEPRAGRKMGHVTATGEDLSEVVYRARAAATFFHG